MILTILSVILLACIAPLLTCFLEYLIGDPWKEEVNTKAIFSRIGVWVSHGYDRTERKIAEKMMRSKVGSKQQEEILLSQKKNWYMVLGACPSCMNVYVSAGFLVGFFIICSISMWWLFAAMPISHFVLGKILE